MEIFLKKTVYEEQNISVSTLGEGEVEAEEKLLADLKMKHWYYVSQEKNNFFNVVMPDDYKCCPNIKEDLQESFGLEITVLDV